MIRCHCDATGSFGSSVCPPGCLVLCLPGSHMDNNANSHGIATEDIRCSFLKLHLGEKALVQG